jgi:hypothetical protein
MEIPFLYSSITINIYVSTYIFVPKILNKLKNISPGQAEDSASSKLADKGMVGCVSTLASL